MPFFRSQSSAAGKSQPEATSAFLQSKMGAPVDSRTRFIMSAVGCEENAREKRAFARGARLAKRSICAKAAINRKESPP
jgi:hypothetical protein